MKPGVALPVFALALFAFEKSFGQENLKKANRETKNIPYSQKIEYVKFKPGIVRFILNDSNFDISKNRKADYLSFKQRVLNLDSKTLYLENILKADPDSKPKDAFETTIHYNERSNRIRNKRQKLFDEIILPLKTGIDELQNRYYEAEPTPILRVELDKNLYNADSAKWAISIIKGKLKTNIPFNIAADTAILIWINNNKLQIYPITDVMGNIVKAKVTVQGIDWKIYLNVNYLNQKTVDQSYNPIVISDEIPKVEDDQNKIFTSVDESPGFPGGSSALDKYLKKNIRYPAIARENNVQGEVFLNFVVEKDGSITDIKVVRGIGSGCDDEAIRVLKSSPSWKPGIQNNRTVRVSYTMPITFTLQQ